MKQSDSTHRRWLPMLLLAAVVAGILFVYPLTLGIPLLDPDEGLHASIAQEMVETGDWIVPKQLGEPFLDKPIFYFWAEALSLRLFGMNEAAVRLPGLMFGLLGAVTTGIVGWRMFGRTTGLVAGMFYATTILPTALAQAAAHDVALVPWINLALLLFWESDRATTRRSGIAYTVAIGVLLGLTCLTKGLVGVGLVGLTYGGYLLLTRRLTVAACVRGASALGIAALVASGWYLAVESRSPGYLYYYFVERHLLGYATGTQSHGDKAWWYYLPIVLAGGLPWIGYLPITIRDSLSRWKQAVVLQRGNETGSRGWLRTVYAWWKPLGGGKNHGAMVLLWVWLIGCTLFLSTSHSKLVTYVWPVFPAVAILAAVAWARLIDGVLTEGARRAIARTFVPSTLVAPVLLPAGMAVVSWKLDVVFTWPVWTAICLIAMTTWLPLVFFRRQQYRATVCACTISISLQFALVMTATLPPVAQSVSARTLAAHFNRLGQLPDRVMIADQRVASLLFYLDADLRAGLRPGQLRHVEMRDSPPLQPGMMLVLPNRKVDRAGKFFELDRVDYQSVGNFRLYQAGELRYRELTASAAPNTRIR